MKNLKMNFYLLFAGMGLLISLGVCSLMYLQFRSHIKATYFDTLAKVALLVEKQCPVLYDVEKLKQGAARDEDWFWEASHELTNIKEVFGLAYIYYIQKSPKGYVFLMSSDITKDYQNELLGEPVWTVSSVPTEMEEAWDKQIMTYSPKPSVEEEWGVLVSAVMPFVKNGETIALLGVDYDISYVNGLQRKVLFFLIISLLSSAVFSGLLAIFGSRTVLISVGEREIIAKEATEQQRKIELLMKELKNSMASKSSFMIGISNAMSIPVNNIIKLASMMMKDKAATENQRETLHHIGDSGMTLHNVINDILDINKIEAGKIKINSAEYKLPRLISGITALYSDPSVIHPVRFMLELDDKLPLKLLGDEIKIKHICSKLLINAFKFTEKGTVLFSVSCKWEDENVLMSFRVRDTGVGIKEKDLPNVFSSYGQIDISEKFKSGGTGMGMYIIERIAKMMHGTISVSSEYGKGSVFSLRLRQKLASKELISPDVLQKLKAFKYTEPQNA